MIVHDLRTPLNSMLFGLQTVAFLGPLTGAQQECLDVFILGCKDSLGVINDLLDISKMESGSLQLSLSDFQPGILVEEAVQRISLLANHKEIRLETQWSPDLPLLRADEEKMGRLLGNLLANAVKFTPRGGLITLGAYLSTNEGVQGETRLVFWVRDSGTGIPREAFERIFEKFGQVESRSPSREMSSGLGLTFCKMIIEAHGGQIWLESEVAYGSTFFAAVPLHLSA